MNQLAKELKKMGISPSEFDRILTDEDIIDIDCVDYYDDEEEE